MFNYIKELENEFNSNFELVLMYPGGSVADVVGKNFTLVDAYYKIKQGDEPVFPVFYNK